MTCSLLDGMPVARAAKSLRLGEPEEGETIKQVGKDPAREYQDRLSTASYVTERVVIFGASA